MSADSTNANDLSTLTRFWLRLAGWLAFYVALIIPWGLYNDWPESLRVSVVCLPCTLLIAAGLARRHGFGIVTPDPPSYWELLISFLLLAVGVATGHVLLMAVAWVCIGVAWLRPAEPDLAWSEWYKLPLLFLFCFPVLTDIAGSRHTWLMAFGGSPADDSTPLAWLASLREKVLFRMALLALAWFVSGTAFWLCIGMLPIPFLLAHAVVGLFPNVHHELILWVVPLAGFFALAMILRGTFNQGLERGGLVNALVKEFKHRSHALWLTALVTLTQQQSLVEVWLAGGRVKLDITGATLLLLTLFIMRLVTPPAPVDFRSRVTLVASQLILFAAEFTDLNPLRHAALGVFLVAAFSWGRTWNWILLAGGSLCWISTLPAGETVLVLLGLGDSNAALARLGAYLGTIIMVVGAAGHTASHPSPPSRAHHDWQPEQRFVFILIALLLLFQTVSAVLPGARNATSQPLEILATNASHARFQKLDSGDPDETRYAVRWGEKSLELRIRHMAPAPVLTTSTEMVLAREHWQARDRHLVSHDYGQLGTLDVSRDNRTGHAVYWFQHGRRTFVSHLRARRILWSSWNLSRRDLFFFLLMAETPVSTEELIEFARLHAWFIPPPDPLVSRGVGALSQ